jgi:hypothetical protein
VVPGVFSRLSFAQSKFNKREVFMADLSPIERVTRFFNREPIDKMPFFTGMGMVLAPAIKKLGYNFRINSQGIRRKAGLGRH